MAAQIEAIFDGSVHADESLRLERHIDDLAILGDRSPQLPSLT